ncbi:MAG: omptin family outer membrane protease [Treponema sp.]|nr:omptin family outer membrane protease [Treponema sp.]
MKKSAAFFAAIFLSLCAAVPMSAQEVETAETKEEPAQKSAWTFTVEPVFGVRLGQSKEIVWRKKSSDDSLYKLSELVYDMLPAWYVGANIGAQSKRFEIKFLSKFFIPARSGNLTDSDWLNDIAYRNGDTTTKTDYSKHSLFLNPTSAGIAGFDLELQAAVKFYPTSFLTLAPLLSFNAQHMNFQGRNGIGYYGNYLPSQRTRASWSDVANRTTLDYDGQTIIDYQAFNLFIWTGIMARFEPTNWLAITATTEVSPIFIFFDYDTHRTNDKFFFDFAVSAFYAFRQSAQVEFKIKKFFSICQTTTFVFTGETHGSMYGKTDSEEKYKKIQNTEAGSQMVYVDLELSAKFTW